MQTGLAETLIGVARVLQPARDPWCIFGGAAYALSVGASEPVNDVDVILSPADAERLAEAHGWRNEADGGTARFRSDWILRPDVGPLPVEMFANFHALKSGAWQEIYPRKVRRVAIGTHSVWVPTGDVLAAIFEICGRSADMEKAAVLRR